MTVVEDFYYDHFVMNSITEARQRNIRMVLRRITEHAGHEPELCDAQAVRAFLNDELSSGLHVNTVRFHQKILRTFFRWCWRREIITDGTWLRIADIKSPRGSTDRAVPRPYKRHEVQQFYAQLDKRWPLSNENMIRRFAKGQSKYGRVYRHGIHLQTEAIVSLALFAGMRASEIRYADMHEIHPDNEYIVARGKSPFGERQGYREIPYTEQGRAIMGRWFEFRALCNPDHDRPWLKLNIHATPNNNYGAGHPFEPIGGGWDNILSTIGAWELHRFRHTCATEWLRAGVPLEKVSKLLGHSDIKETLGYIKIVRTDVRDDMRRAERGFVNAVGRAA
jgi:site-specific recombinase XerD